MYYRTSILYLLSVWTLRTNTCIPHLPSVWTLRTNTHAEKHQYILKHTQNNINISIDTHTQSTLPPKRYTSLRSTKNTKCPRHTKHAHAHTHTHTHTYTHTYPHTHTHTQQMALVQTQHREVPPRDWYRSQVKLL